MGSLVLHIGTAKTGSSAIQGFLTSNAELLANQGVYYPTFPKQKPRNANGEFLYQMGWMRSGISDISLEPTDANSHMQKLSAALASYETTVLSSEHMSMILAHTHVPFTADSYRFFWRGVASVLKEAGARSVTVVVYLRRQDWFLASSWKQNVKIGFTKLPFEEFVGSPEIRFRTNYANIIDAASEALGLDGQIRIRRFDPSRFYGGNIYTDFCEAAGIAFPASATVPTGLVNASLSFDVTEALRRMRLSGKIPTWARLAQVIPLAMTLSRMCPDPSGLTPFSLEEAQALIAQHRSGNQRVARLIDDGEPLFSDDLDSPVWVPNEERIAQYTETFRSALAQG